MYSLISVQEAFAARQVGKPVVCRHVESEVFEKLNNVSAETWFDPHYVFAIEIETIEVAGITFTKPLTADEVQHGDDIYVVQSCGEIHHHKYQVCNEALNQSVARGFAQRDSENAQLQAQAFCKLFGRTFHETPVVEMSDETKQKRKRKSKTELEQIPHVEAPEENASNDVKEKTLTENVELQPEIDPPAESATDITEAQTSQAEEKDVEAIVQQAQDEHYQKLLGELLERASIAKTPNEANALYKYTVRWTEEQRKPLMEAIHSRLVELNPPVNDASLSVRISKAPDLTELDALEIDVSACDEFIQPKLMEMVNKRRAELDPFFNPLGNAS